MLLSLPSAFKGQKNLCDILTVLQGVTEVAFEKNALKACFLIKLAVHLHSL